MTTTKQRTTTPAIPPALRQRLVDAHAAVCQRGAALAEAQADLGAVLIEIKRACRQGDYTALVAQVVPVSPQMARRYADAAKSRAEKPRLWAAVLAVPMSLVERIAYLRGREEIADGQPAPVPAAKNKPAKTTADMGARFRAVKPTRTGVEVPKPRTTPDRCRLCYVPAGRHVSLPALSAGQSYLVVAEGGR